MEGQFVLRNPSGLPARVPRCRRLCISSFLVTPREVTLSLHVPLASDDASLDRDPAEMVAVLVDIRKLLPFLAGQQVNPTKALCSECRLCPVFPVLGPLVPPSLTSGWVPAGWGRLLADC